MTCFLPLTGRFGNLLFQYCFLRAYCERNGLDVCLLPWVGEKVFDIPEAVRPNGKADVTLPEDTHQRQESLIFTRKQVREWLRIKPHVLEMLQPAKCKEQVILNQRKAEDYIGAGLVTLSRESYRHAAMRYGYSLNDCGWETDTEPTHLEQFQGDWSASGFNTTWVGLPSFYRLMTAPVLFRANSTFSFWAATLSDGKVYSPVIKGIRGGVRDQYCDNFVVGNWPVMADNYPNTDLHLKDE